MGLYSAFHLLWNIFLHNRRKVFHLYCALVFVVFCTFSFALCFDVNSPDKEEYLLKSHKVIEALPRALNQPEVLSTALILDGGRMSTDPCSDRKSYEAIRMLHRQLDDDANGDIDVAESDEFLRDELQYENGYERHREFHGEDKFISVDELWDVWKISRVHNWTVEETVEWFLSSVELPEYEHNFRNNGVDGTCLPRMAINSNSLLSGKLGIRDPIHRQKIALKAMDVVLFGPPKSHNFLKDAILVVSIIVATCGCWFAYVQHKYSQVHMVKMMRDMEVLQRAEEALTVMQQELNKAKQQQEMVNIEKLDLERRLKDEMKTSSKCDTKWTEGDEHDRLRELEEQLRLAQNSLHDAEMRLDARSWVAPPTLQHWLQLTHELEIKNYNKKKQFAEMQLQAAKEGCDKLRRKRTTFMGAFRIAHGGSIDDVDDRIIQARTALSEVTTDLQERMHRWKQIEKICGVPIIQNLGMSYLEALLKPPSMNGTVHSGAPSLTRSTSEGTLVREESPPPYAAAGLSSPVLPNIPPPPKYSKTSPNYIRKVASVVPQKNLNSNNVSIVPAEQRCADLACHDVTEVSPDEEDQLAELEDEFNERSTTPVSCSSHSGYSDVGRALGDRSMESAFESHLSIDSSADTFHTELDQQSLCSLSTADASESVRKISACGIEDKKKKKKKSMSSFVASLRHNFSPSNISEQHGSTSSEATASLMDDKYKKEKKVLFPHLRRKKAKNM